MSAPAGNQFWRLRSKHGRDKIFQTPESLWEACQEYFEIRSQHTIDEQDWVGKDAIEVTKHRPIPMSIEGLYTFLGISHQTWKEYRDRKDYNEIVTRIEQMIFDQQYSYAAAGFFNSSIIAKKLGLQDKIDHTTKGESFNELSRMSTEELVQRAQAVSKLNND